MTFIQRRINARRTCRLTLIFSVRICAYHPFDGIRHLNVFCLRVFDSANKLHLFKTYTCTCMKIPCKRSVLRSSWFFRDVICCQQAHIIQCGIDNVNAKSWRCTDVEATLHTCIHGSCMQVSRNYMVSIVEYQAYFDEWEKAGFSFLSWAHRQTKRWLCICPSGRIHLLGIIYNMQLDCFYQEKPQT